MDLGCFLALAAVARNCAQVAGRQCCMRQPYGLCRLRCSIGQLPWLHLGVERCLRNRLGLGAPDGSDFLISEADLTKIAQVPYTTEERSSKQFGNSHYR